MSRVWSNLSGRPPIAATNTVDPTMPTPYTNLWGQAPKRTSFLPRFRSDLARYLPRGGRESCVAACRKDRRCRVLRSRPRRPPGRGRTMWFFDPQKGLFLSTGWNRKLQSDSRAEAHPIEANTSIGWKLSCQSDAPSPVNPLRFRVSIH